MEVYRHDITEGPSGNGERMVFLFDSNKVQFKHIAGEIVLPSLPSSTANTSSLAAHSSSGSSPDGSSSTCVPSTCHGDTSSEGYERRVAEIGAIAKFLKKRADEDGQNYILLGDMNVVSPDDDTMKALKKHKFTLPADLTLDNNELRW
ncbi:MAG: hypothetical protein IPG76_04260 [Acidobacteria bacterium]|nr:hypothetical protein [Acidobacteriota bacterium]